MVRTMKYTKLPNDMVKIVITEEIIITKRELNVIAQNVNKPEISEGLGALFG